MNVFEAVMQMEREGKRRMSALDAMCKLADTAGFDVEWTGGMRVFTFTRRADNVRHTVAGQWESIAWLQGQVT
jgi:hypothetical protein